MFKHPKYYAELRKKARQSTSSQASGGKRQAPSRKHQAPSRKREAP